MTIIIIVGRQVVRCENSKDAPYDYLSDPRLDHNAYIAATDYKTQPWKYTMDRQVAAVEYVNTTQGVYVCAKRGVAAGEELLISYGKPYWRARVGDLSEFIYRVPGS